jgi:hypothetical protein
MGSCETGATCDGDHTTTSATGEKKDCTPYKCESDGRCLQMCVSVNDCVAPNVCDPSGQCVTPASAGDSGGCALAPRSTSPSLAFPLALAALFALRARRRVARNSGAG